MRVSLRFKSSLRLVNSCFVLFLLLIPGIGFSQQKQIIGNFPFMDGGFEGQSIGSLGTSLSTTLWSRQSQSGASSTIVNTGPRSGVNSASVTSASTASRNLQSPQSAVAADGPAISTSYVVQYFVKNASSVNSFQGGVTTNGTSNPVYSTAATLSANATWAKQTHILSTGSTALSSCGIGIAGRAAAGSFEVDDFVIYPGTSVDIAAPNSPGTALVSDATTTSQKVNWGAASGGVDGGGYVVIRYTTSPNADNDPNQNGIYAVGNTTSNGTDALTGTIVYVGTALNFVDTGLVSGTTYFYKIYTVDKAFNYSNEVQVSGATNSSVLVNTLSASLINTNSATLNGSINADNAIVNASFEYGTTVSYGTSFSASPSVVTGSTLTSIVGEISSGLLPNILYQYRAVGTVGATPINGSNFSFWTLANVPNAPVVNGATTSSLNVTLDTNTINENPEGTEYAILTGGQYVNAAGVLVGSAVWQTAAAWGTIAVTGLNDNTEYVFQVQARNGASVATTSGATASGTTLVNTNPNVSLLSAAPAFGNVCLNSNSTLDFSIDGNSLDGSNLLINALSGYTYSLTPGGAYTSTLSLSYTGNTLPAQIIYVRFTPTLVQSYNGNIQITGGGLAASFNVAVTGAGINTPTTVTTNGSSAVTSTSVTLNGTVDSNGCSAVSAYGIEYSLINGFANGTGTMMNSNNLSTGNFSVNMSGLSPNTIYYYKAFATNNGGTTYGSQNSFITSQLNAPVANSATAITVNGFTANWSSVSGADGYRLDVSNDPNFLSSTFTSLVGWNFPNNPDNNIADLGIPTNLSKTLSTVGGTGTITYVSLPGTTTSAATGSGWDNGNAAKYWQVDFSTADYYSVRMSSVQRSSNTGPKDFKVQYRIGAGGAWTDVPGAVVTVANDFVSGKVTSLSLPSVCDNQPSVFLRWIMTSNLQVNTGTVSPSGTSAIDDILIEGKSIYNLPSYDNLLVSGLSQAVSGLSENTSYYYKVRAESSNSTSASSNVITLKTAVNSPTFSGISQAASVCDGTQVTFNVSGLLANSTSTISYTIGSGSVQTVTGVVADGSGFGSFSLSLPLTDDGEVLTVTSVERTDVSAPILNVSSGNTVTISILVNVTYYSDLDNDGFGNSSVSLVSCTGAPAGYVLNNTDCDDNDVNVYQSATLFIDNDGDGYTNGTAVVCYGAAIPTGYSTTSLGADCNDNNVNVYQSSTLFIDNDGDGYTNGTAVVCYGAAIPTGYSTTSLGADCDDNDATKNSSFLFYADTDGDGFGFGDLVSVCAVDASTPPSGYSLNNTDCSPADSTKYQTATLFIDADGDGYTVGTAEVCYGANAPAGYSLTSLGTDCNDQVASINPGAPEVLYNGVDDNCDGELDEGFQITTTIQPGTCGTTLGAINSLIAAVSLQQITAYRFEVTNMTTSAVQFIEKGAPHFSLSELANYSYATTYSIRVMVQRNGIWLGYYGAACLVSSPAILSENGAAQITPSQCGITLPTISTLISTTSIWGATGYRFRVTNTNTNQFQIIDRPLQWFALTMLPTYNYGTTYIVEVAVKTTSATYSGYGSPCNVSSPPVPMLTTAFCGTTIATKNTLIATTSLNKVTSYRFEVTNNTSSQTSIVDRTTNWFTLGLLPANAYAANTFYTVRIAVMTAGVWSPYGDACEIKSPATARTTEAVYSNVFEVSASPNPFATHFGISLMHSSDSTVSIKVYDLLGRLVEQREVRTTDVSVQEIGARYPSGVYNVIVTQDENVKSMRVIKR
jgi:hypothetical protein